jgi:hypothetical protein
MTRKILGALAVAAALAAAPAARAQPQPTRVGFGIGLAPFAPLALTNARIAPVGAGLYLPIQIGPNLRVEPSLSILSFSQSPAADGSAVGIGAGAFYWFVPPQVQQVGFYVGPRLELFFLKSKQANPPGADVETKETDFALTAVMGGEYFVASRFSVGAEAQLALTWYGDRKVSGQPSVSRDAAGLSTNGVVFLRYFFN